MHVPEDIVKFMMRWRMKSRHYNYNGLTDCFDGFFSAFVLYNFLYDLICDYNQAEYPQAGDRRRATEVALQFLGGTTIAADVDIRTNAFAIKGLIEGSTFYIRETAWDRHKLERLASNDNEEWAIGLLDIIYQIRCNTFHGRKSFQEEQKDILVPCIRILERLNDMIIGKIAPNNSLQRTGNPRRDSPSTEP